MSERGCTFVTWNIFHDLPRFRRLDRRLELIAEAIADARPHLVALQEVARAAGCGDIGNRLCALVNERCATAYRIYYAPADGAGEGEYAFDEGVAILSRLLALGAAPDVLKYAAQVELATTVAGHRYRLPDNRVAMRLRFRTDRGSDIDFYVAHLTDATEGPRRRANWHDGSANRAARAQPWSPVTSTMRRSLKRYEAWSKRDLSTLTLRWERFLVIRTIAAISISSRRSRHTTSA